MLEQVSLITREVLDLQAGKFHLFPSFQKILFLFCLIQVAILTHLLNL